MKVDLNDKPIECLNDDTLRFGVLAEAISNQIIGNLEPEGTVYSIYGSWGAGKSSLINLIREKLEKKGSTKRIKISEFKCWWLKDEEKIRIEFINHLMNQIESPKKEEIKRLFRESAKFIAKRSTILAVNQLGKIFGLFGNFGNYLFELFSAIGKKSSQNQDEHDLRFKKLHKLMENTSEKTYLIVIDDLDRLLQIQILTIFNLIKTIGRLPNFTYLIAYDRNVIEKLVSKEFPSEGPHYLEKIVQVGFEIPVPPSEMLKEKLFEQLKIISTKLAYQEDAYFNLIIELLVLPNIITLRDLLRYVNLVKNSWNIIGDYVIIADFLAIEALKVFQPYLFSNLRNLKLKITDEASEITDKAEIEILFDTSKLATYRNNKLIIEKLKSGLMILFPKIEILLEAESVASNYKISLELIEIRGVRTEINFDMYFNLIVPETLHSTNLIEDMTKQSHDFNKVDEIVKYVCNTDAIKENSLKIENFLLEFQNQAEKILTGGYANVLSGIFQNYRNLLICYNCFRKDNSKIYKPSLCQRLSVIFQKLFYDQTNKECWSKLIYDSLETAELDCLIDFTLLVQNQYGKENGDGPVDFLMLSQTHFIALKELTVKKIEEAIANENIYNCLNFESILYNWDRLIGNENYENAIKFCKEKINDRQFILKWAVSLENKELYSYSTQTSSATRKSTRKLPYQIKKDQVGRLMDVHQLVENAKILQTESNNSPDEKIVLEKFIHKKITKVDESKWSQ